MQTYGKDTKIYLHITLATHTVRTIGYIYKNKILNKDIYSYKDITGGLNLNPISNDTTPPLLLFVCTCTGSMCWWQWQGAFSIDWHLLGCCSTASAEYLRWGPSGSTKTCTQSSGSPWRGTDKRMKHTLEMWLNLQLAPGFLSSEHSFFCLLGFACFFWVSKRKGKVATGILSAHAVVWRSRGVIPLCVCLDCCSF